MNTEKMVSRFRRTLSFPKPIVTRDVEKFYHIRSVSLPCRSHPLISQINHDIRHLDTWLSFHRQHPTLDLDSASVVDGLIKLNNLNDSFDDLIHLPKTQEYLRRRSNSSESLLEEFLVYIDVYGRFRAALVGLKEDQCSAQVGIRRRDETSMSLYLKSRKIADKEIKKLSTTIGSIERQSGLVSCESAADMELAGVVADVNRMTVSVTSMLLNAVSGSSFSYKACIAGAIYLTKKMDDRTKRIHEFEQVEVEMLRNLRKRGDREVTVVLKKLEELENCVVKIENESGKLFRSLMNTRVSLLNAVTQ